MCWFLDLGRTLDQSKIYLFFKIDKMADDQKSNLDSLCSPKSSHGFQNVGL